MFLAFTCQVKPVKLHKLCTKSVVRSFKAKMFRLILALAVTFELMLKNLFSPDAALHRIVTEHWCLSEIKRAAQTDQSQDFRFPVAKNTRALIST